jgi:hypothetical protein
MQNESTKEDEELSTGERMLLRFRGNWIPYIRDPSPMSFSSASPTASHVQTRTTTKAIEQIAELEMEPEFSRTTTTQAAMQHVGEDPHNGGLSPDEMILSDIELARKRVSQLRVKYADLDKDAICELLIRSKCRQGCIVGLCSAGPAMLLPGWGSLASLLVGSVADVTITTKLEVDLALEISILYEYALDDVHIRKSYLLKVAGLEGLDDASSEEDAKATQHAGERLALRTTEEVGKRSLLRFVPIVGATVGAGTNVVGIYVIGKRAQLICKGRSDELGTWRQSVDKFVVPKEISKSVADQVSKVPSNISLRIAEATSHLGQRAKQFLASASSAQSN